MGSQKGSLAMLGSAFQSLPGEEWRLVAPQVHLRTTVLWQAREVPFLQLHSVKAFLGSLASMGDLVILSLKVALLGRVLDIV